LALDREKGTFTKSTSSGSNVSQQVNLSNGSLTPKLLIFWTSGQTTSNGTYTDHMIWSYGWSDTANDCCQAMRSHETNENEAYILRNDACISILSLTAGSETARADVSGVAAGQFTLNWQTNDTAAVVIHYEVFGGSDITNVSAFSSNSQNFSTGNHSWNGSGTSFVPDFALIMTTPDNAVSTINTVTSATDQSVFSVGAVTGTSNQWVLMAREETVTTSDNDMYLNNGACLGSLNTGSGAVSYEGTFVSFNNSAGGGITVNITNAAGNTALLAFLLVKGGKWDVNTFQQRSGTGTQNVSITDSTVIPDMVNLLGINSATEGTVQTNHYVCIGGSDGTNEGNCYNGSTNALATWVTARSCDTGKVYRQATPAATATSSTTDAECDMTSMSTAGQFTLDWTTADSTQRQIGYWLVGHVSSGTTFNRSPTAEDVTVSDSSLTRILTANRAPSSDSTTVSDSSLTRMLSATRAPSSDSTTITEVSLERSKTWPRVPTAEDVTVSDVSTTRMLSAVRLPSTENVIVDETLTRMLSASRSPSSDSVTATDSSLTRVLTSNRTVSPDSVTAEDSSTTQMITRVRAPTAEIVTPTDASLTRMIQAFRSPSSDTVTVDESLSGGKLLERDVSADTVTVAESSLTRMLSALRVPSSDTITTGESLIRLLSANRSPTSDSVTAVDSSTTQMITRTRVPTADTITVSESSLTRLLSASRSVSADTITVSDSSLTRVLSALRLPSVEVISTSEDVSAQKTQGAATFERSPEAETIDVVDAALTRILSARRLPSTETITVTDSSLTRMLALIRVPSTETVTVGESLGAQVSGRISRSVEDTVIVSENLSRQLSATRVPTADTVNLNEQLSRIVSRNRVPSADSISVSDSGLTRMVTNIRSLSETPAVVEASLTRVLSAFRSLNDTTVVSEVQGQISLSRRLEETVAVTEPVISRIVTAIRQTSDNVEIDESVFFQAFHKFVFDSVVVAEQLFSEREVLGGSMSYATPAEVRPLLGNIGTQRTNEQITLAIDSAYDEINRRTGRQPPNDWKDTENDFGIVKKICRFKAALEMAVGIKDFDDREWMQKEIEEMFKIIEEGEGEAGSPSTDIVGSSSDTTYALNPQGIIWSVRYQNLKKGGSGENDTTINPDA
jgi:hypothetical protein